MFSVEELKELIEWVSSHRIRGIEVERSGYRVRIEGVAPPPAPPAQVVAAPPAMMPAPVAAAPAAAPAVHDPEPKSAAGEKASEPEEAGLHIITSPIVGTFYRSPGPDKDPFVKLGDHVDKGETLCIIEAMKLMNEIEADLAGEVVQVFAQNAQPVEYGEKLFAIRPS